MQIYQNKKIIIPNAIKASFWLKLRGYMFTSKPKFPALILPNTNCIHMFWVKFPLGLVVLDKTNKIIDICQVNPGQVSKYYVKGKTIIELVNLADLRKFKKKSKLTFK